MLRSILLFLFLIFFNDLGASSAPSHPFEPGDVVFVMDKGTPVHCAVVSELFLGHTIVIDANQTLNRVERFALNDFKKLYLNPNRTLQVRRFISTLPARPRFVANVLALFGLSYNWTHIITPDETPTAVSCTGLVYYMTEDLFTPTPMTFSEPEWETYFDAHRIEMPVGKLGLSPKEIWECDESTLLPTHHTIQGPKNESL